MIKIWLKKKSSFHRLTSLWIAILFIFNKAYLALRQRIHVLYILLAAHYNDLIAYKLYDKQMKYADIPLGQIKFVKLLCTCFQSDKEEIDFVFEGGIHKKKFNIDKFADPRFDIGEQP